METETPEINLITRYNSTEKGLATWLMCHIAQEANLNYEQEMRIIVPKNVGHLFAQRMRTELSRLRQKVREQLGKPAKMWKLTIKQEKKYDRDILIVVKTKNKAFITQEVEKALEGLAM